MPMDFQTNYGLLSVRQDRRKLYGPLIYVEGDAAFDKIY